MQRIGIATALLNDPKLLILDEPTSGLDPYERASINNRLSDLARDKIIIISTHIVSDIEHIANKIILMQNGKISKSGTKNELCSLLEGRLFQAAIPLSDLPVLQENHTVISKTMDSSIAMVRLFSDSPRREWTACQPSLDDVFFYIHDRNRNG